jgi:fatty-acid desaturase
MRHTADWASCIMLAIDLVAFGWWGFLGVGHTDDLGSIFCSRSNQRPGTLVGLSQYVNTADTSTNLIPWAVWIGGEELHKIIMPMVPIPSFRTKVVGI